MFSPSGSQPRVKGQRSDLQSFTLAFLLPPGIAVIPSVHACSPAHTIILLTVARSLGPVRRVLLPPQAGYCHSVTLILPPVYPRALNKRLNPRLPGQFSPLKRRIFPTSYIDRTQQDTVQLKWEGLRCGFSH